MCKHKNAITRRICVNGQSGKADKDKQTPYSNDRVLVPDPEPNLEPFHIFQPQEKRYLGAEPHSSPLKSKRTVLKLLTNNLRE